MRYNTSWMALCVSVLSPLAMSFATFSGISHAQHGSPGKPNPKECETYVVRRVEIHGNAHTRDRSIRRRIALNEGELFSERDIERSIKNLNRWGHLHRLRREDVTVTFASDDPDMPDWHCFADVAVHIKEKR